ncbi:O-methylsterigmatocystin oxidoreductase [Grifola frondosa]|uniref:O-methylsterigmatocystin oxidoreductase n=1 Tax=Grifola frondosa TaxID=5627 RepID=A0A1C7MCM5_GRIFR|nr:O-methylsterigmatocystin oxidoreductase [Grifola frondosa]
MANVLSKTPEAVQKGEEDQLKLIAITMTAGQYYSAISHYLAHASAGEWCPCNPQRSRCSSLWQGIRTSKNAHKKNWTVSSAGGALPWPTVALPYMNALILEVLRWIPVGTLISRRVLEDDEYGGFLIPKGATILANNCLRIAGRVPSRAFLPPTSSSATALEKPPVLTPYYFAFGYGRRVCPGQYLAEAVLFMNAAQILSTFDISCGPSSSSCLEDDIRMVNKGAACRVEHVNCVLVLRSAAKSEQRPTYAS